MKLSKIFKLRYLILVTLGSANVFLFQNCANYSGQVALSSDADPSRKGLVVDPSLDSTDSANGGTTGQVENLPESTTNTTTNESSPGQIVGSGSTSNSSTTSNTSTSSNTQATTGSSASTSTTTVADSVQPSDAGSTEEQVSVNVEETSSTSAGVSRPVSSDANLLAEATPLEAKEDSCQAVAQQKSCSQADTEISGRCDDSGKDDSLDKEAVSECTRYLKHNLVRAERRSDRHEHREHHHGQVKRVVLASKTKEISNERGILVVIGDNQSRKIEISKIENFKGTLILCGVEVGQLSRVRGRVVLVDSNVRRLDYSYGRVVAADAGKQAKDPGFVSVLRGGLSQAGVYSVTGGYIAREAGPEASSTPMVKMKAQFKQLREVLKRDRAAALSLGETVLKRNANRSDFPKIKSVVEMEVKKLQSVLKHVENYNAEFALGDADSDCSGDSKESQELEGLKKYYDYARVTVNNALKASLEKIRNSEKGSQ